MKFPIKVLIPMLLLILATAACGLGGNSSNPPAINNSSSSGSDQTSSSGSNSSGSDQSSTTRSGSSGTPYGTVPLPTGTVDLKAGQVYKIGQAIKDPQSGAIFEVTGIRPDSSLPGLSAGETYLMVDIILGNSGTQTISASSLGSFVVNAKSDGKSYGEGHVLELLAVQAIPSNAGMDVDVAAGTAYHGVLPVVLSTNATGLTMKFSPLLADTMGQPFTVDLGQ
jgi:hypothetical protein